MARRRVNKRWSTGYSGKPLPSLPTTFELYARHLGLSEQSYAESRELRAWCRENRERCYIPEWLLARWGFDVDVKGPR